MMSRVRSALCVVVLILIVSSCAFAQFETSGRTRFGLRLQDYRPTSSALTALSGNWLSPALDWNLKFDDKDRPTQIVSLALFAQDLGPRKAKMMPITFTMIRHSSRGDEPKGWYKGLGFGIYKCEYDAVDYQAGRWANSSGTKLGIQLLAGYDFNEVWFAEVGYVFAGSVSNSVSGNVSFNGISISAGTHVAF